MKTENFHKWRRSFRYAYEGIKYALDTQRNMKFHFFVAFLVLIAAILVDLNKVDILFILLAVTLMIVTELVNTAVEKAVDLAMPDRHPLAKIAKDVAAASVLVSAVFAVVVGLIVFYDPVDRLFRLVKSQENSVSFVMIWIFLALVVLSIVVIESRFSDKGKFVRPSLHTAIAFAIVAMIALFATNTLVILLSLILATMILIVLYDKKTRPFPSLMMGAMIGAAVTLLAYMLMYLI